jgi:serine/threonine protein kinase
MSKPFPSNVTLTEDTLLSASHLGNTLLGKGISGNVHLMYHKSNKNIIIAMKTIPLNRSSQLFRIMDEIHLHQSLNHPHIIGMYGSQFLQDKVLMFMEHAPRGDLYKFLKQSDLRNVLNKRIKLRIFIQTVQAINYIHSRGQIHRDIKPENILLTNNFDVKICDFGWAIKKDHPQRRKSLCGTTEYMAPEILDNQRQTQKIDVWALGKFAHFSINFFRNSFV